MNKVGALIREDLASKVPPQNIEAESGLLGSLLLDKEAIIKIADIVNADDFYVDRNSIIFAAITDLYEARQPLDILTLSNKLEDVGELDKVGGAAYLTELINATPTAAHVTHYAGIVAHKATLRRLIQASMKITEFGYDEAAPLDGLLDRAEQTLFEVSQKHLKQNFTPIASVLAESFDRIDQLSRNTGQLRGVPTGFRGLDHILAGLQKSDLIILAARPSMGKTTLALNVAHHVAVKEGIPVGVFSLEMSKEQLTDRLIASESGIDSWKLRTGKLEDSDFPRLNNAMAILSEAPMFIDDAATTNVMEMRTKARRLQSEHDLGLIIIDYLQLMSGRQTSQENRTQEVSEISRGLKGLARELDVPVIALSQLSRSVETRNPQIPQLADLRESGCLTGDTPVYLPEKGIYAPIRTLAGNSDFKVASINTTTWKLEESSVSRAFSTGTKPILRLTTATGRTIRATANHKFLTISGWKRLDKLQPGETLATPRELKGPSAAQMQPARLALLAHLIGDGCTLPRHAIQYTTREADLASNVVKLATEAFGETIAPRIRAEHSWLQVYLPASAHLTHGVVNPVASWLRELGIFGLRSHEKYVPDAVFAEPPHHIALFLRHLWSTDGCIRLSQTAQKAYPAIYYASSSRRLAVDVQSLLLRLGINARLSRHSQTGKGRDQFHVHITGKLNITIFIKKIGAIGQYKKEQLTAIAAYLGSRPGNPNTDIIPKDVWQMYAVPSMQPIGMTTRQLHAAIGTAYSGSSLYKANLSRTRAALVADTVKSRELELLSCSDVYWDQIKSIEPDGVEEVFDLTVPGNHNFVAGNIIAHNSIEQDADVVMFIYREEYYHPETERANIADIMVKKHRNGAIGNVELFFHPEQLLFRNLDTSHSSRSFD